MFFRPFSVLLCLTMIFLIGCGDGDPATPSGEGDTQSTDGQAPAAPATPAGDEQAIVVPPEISADPVAVTRAFVEAARRGHGKAAFALMTTKAREALEGKSDFMRLPVSDNAKLTVGQAQIRNETTVWVPTVLTDFNSQGVCKEYEMVWGLRKESDGWRVGGVALEVIPNRPPLILDFEKPEEQKRKTELAIKEMERLEAARAAGQTPVPPTGPIRQATQVPAGQTTPGGTIPR